MPGHIRISAMALAAVIFASPAAGVGPNEDVAASAARWAATLSTGDLDGITALYAKDAMLWGTKAPALISDPAGIRNYFESAFKAFAGAKITLGEGSIRVYGDFALNSGTYRIDYAKDGAPMTIDARYSFAYRKQGEGWLIVDQHSSPLPQPNKDSAWHRTSESGGEPR